MEINTRNLNLEQALNVYGAFSIIYPHTDYMIVKEHDDGFRVLPKLSAIGLLFAKYFSPENYYTPDQTNKKIINAAIQTYERGRDTIQEFVRRSISFWRDIVNLR